MRKITWIPLVILVVGLVFVGIGWATGGHRVGNVGLYWQDGSLHVAGVNSKGEVGKLVTIDETYKASDVKSIDLNIDYLGNIVVKEGDEGSDIKVIGANYEEYGGIQSQLSGDVLSVSTIKKNLDSYWFINMGVLIESEKCFLEITLPKGIKLNSFNANVDASDIELYNLDCVTAMIINDYGNIKISGVDTVNMELLANAGMINADNMNVAETFKIDNDFGDIKLSNISAEDITIDANAGSIDMRSITSKKGILVDNDYGDVSCTDIKANDTNISLDAGLLSVDKAVTDTATFKNQYGNVNIDRFTLNGLCDIKSEAGKVYVGLTNNESEVVYNLDADNGRSSIGGRSVSDGGKLSQNVPSGKIQINIENSFGDIELEFGK